MEAQSMEQWFEALTAKEISRNKQFDAFSAGWPRWVHQRYRMLCALKREVERCALLPGTTCWPTESEGNWLFHLQCPRMGYARTLKLYSYEWEWLRRQPCVQAVLQTRSLTPAHMTM